MRGCRINMDPALIRRQARGQVQVNNVSVRYISCFHFQIRFLKVWPSQTEGSIRLSKVKVMEVSLYPVGEGEGSIPLSSG